MSFEAYREIYNGGNDGLRLRANGKAHEVSFTLSPREDLSYRLFTVGETEQFYQMKNEPDCPVTYRSIVDALDSRHAIRDRFCLNLTSKKYEEYIRRVYKRISFSPLILSYLEMVPVPTEWTAGITVSAKSLKYKHGGYLRMRVEVRRKKEGVPPLSVSGAPDDTLLIDLPEGSYTGERLTNDIHIPSDTALVCVFIEGKGYRGEVYLEEPTLEASGHNLLPKFTETTADITHMDWVAQYLSRKEWPEFRVRLNGQVIFTGEVFERCHRGSEWEIPLPRELLKEENTLSYELISDYRDPLPYTVFEVGIIEAPCADISILSVSEAAPSGGFARVLIKTAKPQIRARLVCESEHISGDKELFFKEKGLHGVLISCLSPAKNIPFRIITENEEIKGVIPRIAVKGEDSVITGSGDMVYIAQDPATMESYLSWYLSNNVGDLITIRPVYRWSGTRVINKRLWRDFKRLMKELSMKYVVMADGRELPGVSANPDKSLIGGEGFLGTQLHERDGAQFYWRKYTVKTETEAQFYNMMEFAYNDDPIHTSSERSACNYFYYDGIMNIYADRREFDDYRDEHKKAVESLAAIRQKRDNRHTGPASTFKYLAEAGYSWLGAETMYQTMEPIMGFLRGVVKDRRMKTFGVHHAVQWSTSPHECEARYRRYRLALYASYMQGATDINTEEGLWRLEEYFSRYHRFSNACRRHLKEQQDFFRYISTHTRRGKLYNPAALISGRDDGITFFGKDKTWGQAKPQTEADDSWEILTAVYPLAKPIDAVYVHNCPEDKPVGFHSGTPYGNLDILPMEARSTAFEDYKAFALLGYNRCEGKDFKKLLKRIRGGARLLLCDAHLTVTSSYTKIKSGDIEFGDELEFFTDGKPEFISDTKNGHPILVCKNSKKPTRVLEFTDNGAPLVCSYKLGLGEVILFHTKNYPASAGIRPLYESALKRLFSDVQAEENIWAEVGDDVEFAVYENGDEKHVYLLAVDWYRDPSEMHRPTLRIGEYKYSLSLPFGVILKCVCRENVGCFANTEDGEVLSISDGCAEVQGIGKVGFTLAKSGTLSTVTVDFDSSPVQKISF